jgi:hypothetical protein
LIDYRFAGANPISGLLRLPQKGNHQKSESLAKNGKM